MAKSGLNRFYLGIVFPSILSIVLFIFSIFVVILPAFERGIMNEKKGMLSELTNTVSSLLDEYNLEVINNNLSLEEAQKMAAYRVEQIRYGGENKDYFWITDQHPTMIMHPYRPELLNTDLSNYKDAHGKKLFIEAALLVKKKGDGFIDYMWQWKDDSVRIVPKLSYVQEYQPWGWIIGTGIYLEDVKLEIAALKNRIIRLSLIIAFIISVILLYVIRQSLNIENKRKTAELDLSLSNQKYKSLVAASTEGTLMILNNRIIFSNEKFSQLIGYDNNNIGSLKFEDIFNADCDQLISSFDDSKKSHSFETQIKCSDNSEKDVILSVSKIKYADDQGYIIITKEIPYQKQIERETKFLSQELQTSLLLMNQPLKTHISELIKCSAETSIKDAVLIMTRRKSNVLFVQKDNEIIGVINNNDLKKRVLAKNLDTQKSVTEIMTSPLISISENALLYEAVLLLKRNNITHLAIKNRDEKIIGVIDYLAIISMQQNFVSYLIKEIGIAENIQQLIKIQKKIAVIVNALIESGDKTQIITRIITSVADAIHIRIISFVIEDLGKPPCNFAFMVMGSEGRMEQTLSTDQDNAIVFENLDGDELDAAYLYFTELGQKVSHKLNEVGYRFCKGDIMAQNPKWNQPLSVWKNYYTHWMNTNDPQSILDACIFFDFRFVCGTASLIDILRSSVNKAIIDDKSVFFYHLAQPILKYRPPLSLFGKIIGAKPSSNQIHLDIKKILLPITDFARLYSLRNKINETNTLDRVEQLYFKEVIDKAMYNDLVLTYNYLMHIRLRTQTKNILQNKTPDNLVNMDDLSHIEIATIKKFFASINNLQIKLNFDFKGTM